MLTIKKMIVRVAMMMVLAEAYAAWEHTAEAASTGRSVFPIHSGGAPFWEMALPALLGRWIDVYLGTHYWFLVGLVAGPVLGFWHLLVMTGVVGGKDENNLDPEDN